MRNNRATLDRLFADKAIDLQESPLLNQCPPLTRLGVDFDKVEGMLLGLAVGDALVSSLTLSAMNSRYLLY